MLAAGRDRVRCARADGARMVRAAHPTLLSACCGPLHLNKPGRGATGLETCRQPCGRMPEAGGGNCRRKAHRNPARAGRPPPARSFGRPCQLRVEDGQRIGKGKTLGAGHAILLDGTSLSLRERCPHWAIRYGWKWMTKKTGVSSPASAAGRTVSLRSARAA